MSNKIVIAKEMIDSAPSNAALIDLPPIRENWIDTYKMTSGRDDGAMKYEAEKIMFLNLLNDSWSLQQCSKASVFSAWTELAVSGLTLRDGLTYIIPYSKVANFQVGWKGRLEQINEMTNVVHVQQPQVVYKNDTYDLILGEKATIKDHKRAIGERGEIVLVYVFIKMRHGVEFYYMERDEVLSIRDRYSQTYLTYLSDCKAANKKVGETFFITKKKKDNTTYQAKVEPPMWITDEAQAFKKTLIKRIYGELPKLPKHKYLDERMKVVAEKTDVDEMKQFEEFTEIVDGDTGEVIQTAEIIKPTTQQPQQPQKPAQQKAQPATNTSSNTPQNQQIQDAIVEPEGPNLEEMAQNTAEGF